MDADSAKAFHCPRWSELPTISLYMDQVVIVLEEALRPVCGSGEPVVTPTMINNYVKQRMLAPPERKKYGRQHMAALVVISVLKRALSMPEILGVMEAMKAEYGAEAAYDRFCEELERTLRLAFESGELRIAPQGEGARSAHSAALAAWAGKLLVQEYLALNPREAHKQEAVK